MWKIITQGIKKCDEKNKDETKDINNEVWWRMMLGQQKNSEEGEPISPQLMKLSNKIYIHQKTLIPV